MPDIATVEEFASYLQSDLDTATANLLLLDLAQGLVTDEIGLHDPWPAVAKAVALSAAGRSYTNPDSLKQETVGSTVTMYNPLFASGVYLSADEKAALSRWLNGPGGSNRGRPQGIFPDPYRWPDPVQWRYPERIFWPN